MNRLIESIRHIASGDSGENVLMWKALTKWGNPADNLRHMQSELVRTV